ncbi:RNA 2',3'-cyclic phosphodiesterase [Halalkalibacterium ligniniphilum]|uniref:RNA 2',3'-cyclic phosphodiesterase n=1 Tax=Halalkalibacterium ligniniphilum TaxID=1134413 RepID=UPI00034AD7A8|nr:RNA 2',3'-cyclic phosphodiesterase [Halalkalibacterium ligniniphilum]
MRQPHFFLALPLPKNLKENIASKAQEIPFYRSFKKWLHPEDLHITLVFLGAMEENQYQELVDKCQSLILSKNPFSLTTNHFSFFGQQEKPRIFWLGVEQSNRLAELQGEVQQICLDVGMTVEKRPYRPHITLAKRWSDARSFAEVQALLQPLSSLTWEVNEFVLYRTNVDKIPSYEIVERFSFQQKGE